MISFTQQRKQSFERSLRYDRTRKAEKRPSLFPNRGKETAILSPIYADYGFNCFSRSNRKSMPRSAGNYRKRQYLYGNIKRNQNQIQPGSYRFFTNRQRIALSTARIITPTSAKIARYIFAMPIAPSARQANLTISAMAIFW